MNLDSATWRALSVFLATGHMFATVNEGGDTEVPTSSCEIRSGESVKGSANFGGVIMTGNSYWEITVSALVSVPAGGAEISVWCNIANANFGAANARLVTMQVGTLF